MRKALVIDLAPYADKFGGIRPVWNDLRYSLHHCIQSSSNALELLSKELYSVVIIHIWGAASEGMELCEKIRSANPVPVILAGGSTDYYWLRKALQLQVSEYIPAPFTVEELNLSLQEIMEAADFKDDPHLNARLHNADAAQQGQVIEKVKEYVKDSMGDNITLKEIAEKMHFNYSYLVQKFKTHENMTFNEYVLRQRMEKAKSLLTHTDKKIYEIAEMVGYNDMDWFYKKFKSFTGISANHYRKVHLSQSLSLASGQR